MNANLQVMSAALELKRNEIRIAIANAAAQQAISPEAGKIMQGLLEYVSQLELLLKVLAFQCGVQAPREAAQRGSPQPSREAAQR